MARKTVNGPKQLGTVLIFKQGVDPSEVARRLELMRDLLDGQPRLNEFNPDWGFPVWYIP
jgi:hypothetical protein